MSEPNKEAAKMRAQRNQALVREGALKAMLAKAGVTDEQVTNALGAVANFSPANVDHGVLSGADAQTIAGMLPEAQEQNQASNPMEMFMQMMQNQQPNQQQQQQQQAAPKPSLMEQMMPVFMMSMMNNMMQNQSRVAELPETPSGGQKAASGGLTPENIGKMNADQINANWDGGEGGNIIAALEGQGSQNLN